MAAGAAKPKIPPTRASAKANGRQPRARKTTLRPYKIIVQLVVQEVEDGGEIVGEHPSQPTVFYSKKKAIDYLRGMEKEIANARVVTPEEQQGAG
jgi:hypothetical protein